MVKQFRTEKKEKDLDVKIESLREFADSLLEEIKSLKSVKKVQIEEGINFYDEVEKYQIQLIETALEAAGGCQKVAARLLNLKPTTLHMKIKNLNVKKS